MKKKYLFIIVAFVVAIIFFGVKVSAENDVFDNENHQGYNVTNVSYLKSDNLCLNLASPVCIDSWSDVNSSSSGDITDVLTSNGDLIGGASSGSVDLSINYTRINNTIMSFGYVTTSDDNVSGSELEDLFSTTIGLLYRSGVGSYQSIGIGNTFQVSGGIFMFIPGTIAASHLNLTDITLSDFTNDAGFITSYNDTWNTTVQMRNAVNNSNINILGTSVLGNSIEGSEITDSTIGEADLNVTNAPTNAYVLSYNTSAGRFTWAEDQVGAPGAGDIEAVLTPDKYLYGGATSGSVSLYLNETALNSTIDARDSDTTYSAGGDYLYLSTTTFLFNETKLNATIGALAVDTNNYPTSISVTGTSTKTINLARNGLANISANFADIDTWNTTTQMRTAVNNSNVNILGTAAKATALAANGANCGAGNYPLGVDASGAVEDCTADDDTPDNDAEVPNNITITTSFDITLTSGAVLNISGTCATPRIIYWLPEGGCVYCNSTYSEIHDGDGSGCP